MTATYDLRKMWMVAVVMVLFRNLHYSLSKYGIYIYIYLILLE
jgi:hypothetical protein